MSTDDATVADTQRRHLRRIMWCFLIVVIALPIAGLGGTWTYLLLPLVAVSALALREGMALRQSVRRHGARPGQ
jgi:hypothetical protein